LSSPCHCPPSWKMCRPLCAGGHYQTGWAYRQTCAGGLGGDDLFSIMAREFKIVGDIEARRWFRWNSRRSSEITLLDTFVLLSLAIDPKTLSSRLAPPSAEPASSVALLFLLSRVDQPSRGPLIWRTQRHTRAAAGSGSASGPPAERRRGRQGERASQQEAVPSC
jgi:hypothetical protein